MSLSLKIWIFCNNCNKKPALSLKKIISNTEKIYECGECGTEVLVINEL